MDSLQQLQELSQKTIEVYDKIRNDIYYDIHEQAPVIVKQRLCNALVEIMKANNGKAANEIPEAINILTAIDVLNNLYPNLQ